MVRTGGPQRASGARSLLPTTPRLVACFTCRTRRKVSKSGTNKWPWEDPLDLTEPPELTPRRASAVYCRLEPHPGPGPELARNPGTGLGAQLERSSGATADPGPGGPGVRVTVRSARHRGLRLSLRVRACLRGQWHCGPRQLCICRRSRSQVPEIPQIRIWKRSSIAGKCQPVHDMFQYIDLPSSLRTTPTLHACRKHRQRTVGCAGTRRKHLVRLLRALFVRCVLLLLRSTLRKYCAEQVQDCVYDVGAEPSQTSTHESARSTRA
jgi:hypothetical protein